MSKQIIICVLWFIPFLVFPQDQKKIDSLLQLTYSADDTTKANLYNRISLLYQGNDNSKTKLYADKIMAIGQKTKRDKYISLAYLKLGVYYYFEEKQDSAFKNYRQCIIYAKRCNNIILESNARQNLAVLHNMNSDYIKSIEENMAALKLAQLRRDDFATGQILLNISTTYYRLKDFQSCEQKAKESLAILSKLNRAGALGAPYMNLALVSHDRNQFEDDIRYNYLAIKEFERIYDYASIATCYNNIYLAYFELQKPDSAMAVNKRLNRISRETDSKLNLFSSYVNFGVLYTSYFPDPIKGKMYFDSAALCNEVLDYPIYRRNYLFQRCKFEFTHGEKAHGIDLLTKYIELSDSIKAQENEETVKEINTRYETEKKDLQIKEQQSAIQYRESESKRKSVIIWLSTLALLGTGFFAVMAFINFRKSKKANMIIQNQNHILELQKKEVEHQKELVEEKQQEIIDSINYAKRIQNAVLTGDDVWKKLSPAYFILFKPKDIVSGDFYWAYNFPNGRSVFCVADCTGHGVPGGFMSMLGNSFLNELVIENKLFKADVILNKLREKVIHALEQKGKTEQKDGMDISLCVWNKLDNTLEFAGANNSIWLLRNKELTEYKADKMPIGTYAGEDKPFSSITIPLQKDDTIYMSTDGYPDQFGGPHGKKFKYKNLEALLTRLPSEPFTEQRSMLETEFENWKGKLEQLDDVCIIGIRIH